MSINVAGWHQTLELMDVEIECRTGEGMVEPAHSSMCAVPVRQNGCGRRGECGRGSDCSGVFDVEMRLDCCAGRHGHGAV